MKLLDMQMHVVPINYKNEHNRLFHVWAQRLPGLKPPTLMSTKAAGPKAPNFNEHAMNSNFQQLRQQHAQLIRLIIMDNFLNSNNIDRLMQLQDTNSQ